MPKLEDIPANFRDKDGDAYVVRCPECLRENYAMSVAAGICAWCGWNENRDRIFQEDCLKTMKRMGNNSVNLVVTSPPYNMNLRIRNGKYCSRQIIEKEFSNKYKNFSDNLPVEDFYELHLAILKELLRVSPIVFYNIAIVTGSKRAFFKIIGEMNEYLKDIIVWDKMHGEPAMQEGVLNRRSELILVFERDNAISRKFKDCNFGRGGLEDLWEIKKQRSKNKKNKAVFPEELVEKILINFSNEKDTVYDPFCGTGTTCRVAKKLNRYYIGSEMTDLALEAKELLDANA